MLVGAQCVVLEEKAIYSEEQPNSSMTHEATSLIPGDGIVEPEKSLGRRIVQRVCTKSFLFVFLLALLTFLAVTGRLHGKRTDAALVVGDEVSPVMHRPVCKYYKHDLKVSMVQTSLQEPSRQWTPMKCIEAPRDPRHRLIHRNDMTRAKLNTYQAPDAIIKVELDTVAHPEREPIMGFGGAFTEASSLNYHSLNDKGKEAVMELLFGKTGLGYSLGRVHINSCDFCVASYDFDDVEDDFELKHFDMGVQHDVVSGMVDMMLMAKNKTPNLQIMASPWSPPPWMKKRTKEDKKHAIHAENMTNSAEPTCLREGVGPSSRYAKAWALYFAKFISAYKDLGIPLFAVSVQNEPEFAAAWEACSYTAKTQGKFLAYHLGPTLRELHPEVKIFMFDHNKDHAPAWAKKLLNHSHPASSYIDGTAIHWYAGGMDRLLDGAVGIPNFHRLVSDLQEMQVKPDHLILGSEACHCPTTAYAGGDIDVAWARAERYAHTILADLAAGSNGWIEWNLILDSIGGPNHLGNVCDSPILAVPHRAEGSTVVADEMGFPLPVYEPSDHPFGRVVGDGRTREELNALGFPAKYLDVGVVVQPLYYYMGHISRHVRPGSKAVKALVDRSEGDPGKQTFRPRGQVVAGGGINDLAARLGVELTTWPCEGSTRQQFKYNDEKQLQVFGHDWLGMPISHCIANKPNKSFKGLLLAECKPMDSGMFDIVPLTNEEYPQVQFVQFVLTNGNHTDPSQSCLVIEPLKNDGGAYGPRGGAQVTIGSCSSPAAEWIFMEETGEISSTYFLNEEDGGEVCLTTGWPFLQVGAFDTPNGDSEKAVVVLNEAGEAANYAIKDGNDVILTGSIPAHSIQTISLS